MTILPLRCRFITGITAWVNRKVPSRLKAISFCQSAKVSSSVVRLRIGDHRAAADRVDQDVDPAVVALDLGDQLVDLRRVERVDQPALRLAARLPPAWRSAGTASSSRP